MGIELKWIHQQETYERMNEQLKKTHKAAFIYPTSCGKSFPPLKYLEENQEKRVIILASTIEILEQYKEYIQKYIMESDEPVKKKFPNWHFITYHGLKRFNISVTNVDVIISDELHRVGAEKWGEFYDILLANNPDADKIGMTAILERTDGKNMIDEYFADDIVYELSKIDALSGDKTGEVVLKPSRYVRVLSELKPVLDEYKEKLDGISEGREKNQLLRKYEKLEKTISAASSLKDTFTKAMKKKDGKYIVFCKNEEDMKKAMKKASDWFSDVNPNMMIDYVFSGSEGSEMRKTDKANRDTMNEFKNPSDKNKDKLKLLFCVDKLNEGLHVDEISGIIMLRPTESSVLYEQQMGRAFITVDKEQEETVIIDVANNWLRFLDKYKEYVESIEKGKTRRQTDVVEKEKQSYSSYDLVGEEIELLELLKEIDQIANRSSVAETLRVAEILKDNGVDVARIQLSKRISKHEMHDFFLSEIEQDGVDIKKIIEENNLDPEFPYGSKVKRLVGAYNGSKKDILITELEKKKAEELGLVSRDKNRIMETLRISRILKDNGVDLKKIQLSERVSGTKRHKRVLSEIKQEGIDIGKIIEEYNLDGEFPYGRKITQVRTKYNEGTLPKEMRREVEDLGLIDMEKSEKHPYLKLLEEIREWQRVNQKKEQLPKHKSNPKDLSEEIESKLAERVTNLKMYIKTKKEIELSDEEREIIEAAEKMGITGKSKHPYLILLEDVQEWQKANETVRIPMTRVKDRKLPAEQRSQEFILGKRIGNLINAFLKRYNNITDEEFLKLSEDEQKIILICGQMGIGDKKNKLVQRMKGYVAANIESNSDVRKELMQRVVEFKAAFNKGEVRE